MRPVDKIIIVLQDLNGHAELDVILDKYLEMYPDDFSDISNINERKGKIRDILALYCIGFTENKVNRNNTAYFKQYDTGEIYLNQAMLRGNED